MNRLITLLFGFALISNAMAEELTDIHNSPVMDKATIIMKLLKK